MAFLPLIHMFHSIPGTTIFAPQVVWSLITPASSVAKQRQLNSCNSVTVNLTLLHIRRMYSKTTMDEFEINFDIFGKDGDSESWLKTELSSLVKK